jgi:hypothetical protein
MEEIPPGIARNCRARSSRSAQCDNDVVAVERNMDMIAGNRSDGVEMELGMARKVQVLLEDDIDGGEAAETITFALDGRSYEIDLNEGNARKLRDAFAPWVGAARRAGSAGESRPRASRRSTDTGDIRRWAAENGIAVSSRGRISADLRARYEAAH